MAETLRPADEAETIAMVAAACAGGQPLELTGQGSKRALGRPLQVALALDTTALTGVTLYEPDELVLAARAGTPLAELEALLAENGQQFAFEPADYGPLLGGAAGRGSMGGVFAANLAGPRRLAAGAARDHILGLRAVSGRGEAFKAGGRVVKNVTGFDLPKLLAGSYGTLAVMTEITCKVLPRPEKVRTVLVFGLDDGAAVAALTAALQSSHEVSAAAHLPATVAARSGVPHVAEAGAAVTAVRVEGPAPSVVYRCAALRRALAGYGPSEELHGANSARLWREIRDVMPFVGDDRIVWRLALPPARGPATVAAIARDRPIEAYYDRGGGQVWLATGPADDGGVVAVRAAAAAAGGTATLVRAAAQLRAHVPVFPPPPPPLRELIGRVKAAFDPAAILNPGRMYPGL